MSKSNISQNQTKANLDIDTGAGWKSPLEESFDTVLTTSFEDLIDDVVPGATKAIQKCVLKIAMLMDAVDAGVKTHKLSDASGLGPPVINKAVKDIKVAADRMKKGSEGPEADQKGLRDNLLTITTGAGGFFDLRTRLKINNTAVLNSAYGHLALGVDGDQSPATWLAKQSRKKTVVGIGWSPEPSPVISIEGMPHANT